MLATASNPREVKSSAGDKITGGIVDKIGQGTFPENRLDHLIDRQCVSYVDSMARDPATMLIHQFRPGLITDPFASAATPPTRTTTFVSSSSQCQDMKCD